MKPSLRFRIGFFLALSLVLAVPIEAEVLINFDVDTDDNPLPSGTLIDSTYASWGVTFVNIGDCSDHIYTSQECLSFGTPPSEPNVVTICAVSGCSDISELGNGMVRAEFDRDAMWVCIDAIPSGTDLGVLRAFDISNAEIDSTLSTGAGVEMICIHADGIRAVQFSGYQHDFGWFDNLAVEFAPVATEPMTWSRTKARYR